MSIILLLIDIDGLRADVFTTALKNDAIPNIARLLGGKNAEHGLLIPAIATAPSITFASQASLFTGAHPSQHGIPGNQFFDRFGRKNVGKPRLYAFDIGDTLAGDDAVMVFSKGLASECLMVPTFYERFADFGWKSVVAGNMYAQGAENWLKPSMVHMARFTKGGNLFGMDSASFDRYMLEKAINYLSDEGIPEVMTLYFMGLDHESHLHGPKSQLPYLTDMIDPMVGEFWEGLQRIESKASPLIAIFSDHGQIQVIPDDQHSLRLAFPFEREIGHLFDALGLDVHDFPGEDPQCDAVVCSNGGVAHVYLQNKKGMWCDVPDFERDIRTVGNAFWKAHQTGKYATELHGALAGVLLRNVEMDGWYSPYYALTEEDEIVTLERWFSDENQSILRQQYSDPVHRLSNLCGPMTGDILLISNYADGYYFSAPLNGVHGGLHPEDSQATLAFGFLGVDEVDIQGKKEAVLNALFTRCRVEGNREPSTADLLTCVLPVLAIE